MAGKREGLRTWGVDLLYDLAGCFILSVAIQCISAPNNIAPGGITGLAILINYLFGFPISALNFLLNLPLVILAWMLLGHGFTLKTLKTVVVFTVMLDLVERFLPVYQGDMLLAALYNGVIQGVGLALVMMRSSTTGGTDIASRLLQLKFPHMQVGKLLLILDGVVLLCAAVVYRNIESALYALISIYVYTKVIDSILYGMDTGKVMMIISNRTHDIAVAVNRQLERGCTILQGKGSYTGTDRPVLLCAVRRAQAYQLKNLIRGIDPTAFLVVVDAGEIIGEGFKDIHKRN